MLTLIKYGHTENTTAAQGNLSLSIPSFLNPHSSPSSIPGSTGFLTDVTGAVNEHIEYTAWADATSNNINMRRARAIATGCETWLEKNIQLTYNGSEVNIPKYMYTSKELDTQTHLYYFGARYYDPKTSLWVSTDPILGRYLDAGEKDMSSGGGHAGILDSKNMGLYTYCHQNPMIMVDPDGNVTVRGDYVIFHEADGDIVMPRERYEYHLSQEHKYRWSENRITAFVFFGTLGVVTVCVPGGQLVHAAVAGTLTRSMFFWLMAGVNSAIFTTSVDLRVIAGEDVSSWEKLLSGVLGMGLSARSIVNGSVTGLLDEFNTLYDGYNFIKGSYDSIIAGQEWVNDEKTIEE